MVAFVEGAPGDPGPKQKPSCSDCGALDPSCFVDAGVEVASRIVQVVDFELGMEQHICEFGFPGPLRDRLVDAVLSGAKTAT